ncbi:MAG: DUF1015 family protein [Elusimicrobia bacterium]|nr:DUF1015 family protein [Elusimicrobiota bacterium]
MVKIIPFEPIVYDFGKDKTKFIAPPYDIITAKMRDELYRKSRYNVVRLILGRKYSYDSDTNNWYKRAARFFRKWLSGGILHTGKEGFFIFEQKFSFNGKKMKRTGIVARLDWAGTDERKIIHHEKTFPKHKQDRLNLLRKLPYNFSPIFLLAEGSKKLIDYLCASGNEISFYKTSAERGKLLEVDRKYSKNVSEFFKRETFIIADGHHRLTVSRNYYKRHPAAKYLMVYITDPSSDGCLILSGKDKKTPIDKSFIGKVIRDRKLLPQKTTYFWPKLPSGLLIHPIK